MPTTDSGTSSPRGALSKLRRNQGGSNNSSASLASNSNSDDPNADSERRLSTASGIGKLKERLRRKSVDDRRGSDDSESRLSKLISSGRNSPKKTPPTDFERSLNVETSDGGNLDLSGNRSDSSLALDGSGRSSILTDDNSEPEG